MVLDNEEYFTGATGREAALLTYKWLFCSVGELVFSSELESWCVLRLPAVSVMQH